MDSLKALLALDEDQKRARGVVHTPGEIAAQPALWRETAAGMLAHRERLAGLLDGVTRVVLTGSGSSYYVGKGLERALSHRLGLPVCAVPGTEIVMDPEGTLPRQPFLLVSFARSGESPEGNAAFELADRLREGLVRQVAVTCNPEGTLARLAQETPSPAACCLLPPATHDRGLAMTSSFTSMFVACLFLGWTDDPEGYLRLVERLAQAGQRILDEYDEPISQLARKPLERVFFVGSGALFGAALEAHLKVQELSDGVVLGKAEDTLGLRHGPMAAINEKTLFGLFASAHPYRRRYETDLLREVDQKGLGLARLVVCPHPEPEWEALADVVVAFDREQKLRLPDAVTPPLAVVVGQLLALHKSLALGLTPDRPSRKGVINRVVQGVHIYPYPAGASVGG